VRIKSQNILSQKPRRGLGEGVMKREAVGGRSKWEETRGKPGVK